MNWEQEIAKLVYIKQVLSGYDHRKLWPHHLPAVAATREQIAAAENALGYPLVGGYGELLRHANGWRGFYQTIDLFSTEDIIGGARKANALEMFGAVDDGVIRECGIPREDLVPIAASMLDRHLFVMASPRSRLPGEVLWFAGELIDRFPTFEEFFLAMMDYNRSEIDYFKQEQEK